MAGDSDSGSTRADRQEEVFAEAVRHPAGSARVSYLDAVCAGDAALRKRIEALLAAHEAAVGNQFLDLPGLGATADTPSPLSEGPGTKIGHYKLLQQIGEGGFGVVFMAEQEFPVRRKVALKIIKLGMDTRQVVARFEVERQALAMMDHPNVARVFDAGATSTGRPYFVMELVQGVPITAYCDANNLSIRQRLELFGQVCHAVQHAHQKGIIHRDIKPTNVLVGTHDNHPVAKVIDFGVAKATQARLTEKTLFTEFHQWIGTPQYMSPEQAGSVLDIDTRSDVYALGVLLYELLTGTTPFEARELREKGYAEIQRMIREVEPPSPSTRLSQLEALPSVAATRQTDPGKLRALLHGELDWIVMKCLEKDRARRYESASVIASDVRHYLLDEPVIAAAPSRLYRLRKYVRRNRPAVAFVTLLLVFIALLAVGNLRTRRERDAKTAALAERETALRIARQSERRALTEMSKATSVSGLVQDMLQAAHPDEGRGIEYTVRQLLDHFSNRLDDQLKDQPEVEADIRAIIAKAYSRAAWPDHAEPHVRKALELARKVYGPRHEKTAEVLLVHSRVLFEQSRLPEAREAARTAIEVYRQAGASGERLMEAWWEGMLSASEEECQAIAGEAFAYSQAQGKEYRQLACIQHRLALLAWQRRSLEEAETLAREALVLHRRLDPPNDPETAHGLIMLAWVLLDRGRPAEAETPAREALAIFRHNYDGEHKSVLNAQGAVWNALQAQKNEAGMKAFERECAEWDALRARREGADALLRRARARFGYDPRGAVEMCDQLVTLSGQLELTRRKTIASSLLRFAQADHRQRGGQVEGFAWQAIRVFWPMVSENIADGTSLEGLGEALRLLGEVPDLAGRDDTHERIVQDILRLLERLNVTGAVSTTRESSGTTPAQMDRRWLHEHQAIAHRILGQLIDEAARLDEAIQHLHRAIQLYSEPPAQSSERTTPPLIIAQLQRTIAERLLRAGRQEESIAEFRGAVNHFRLACDHAPADKAVRQSAAECQTSLALALMSAGQHEQALRQLAAITSSAAKEPSLEFITAHAYCRSGIWNRGSEAFDRGLAIDPSDHWQWFRAALAHLMADDVPGYRRICREMLDRFGKTDAAWLAHRVLVTCLLDPDTIEAGRYRVLADRCAAVPRGESLFFWCAQGKGLEEYRAGQPREAADWIERCAPSPDGRWGDATAFSILALARHALGQADEARAALRRARVILEKMPPPDGTHFLEDDWHDWVHGHRLFREAESLLTESTPATRPIATQAIR